jgi:hypothetical protein
MREYVCGTCKRDVPATTRTDYAKVNRESYELAPHGTVWGGECPNRDRVAGECECGHVAYVNADGVAATVAAGGSPWTICGSCTGKIRF